MTNRERRLSNKKKFVRNPANETGENLICFRSGDKEKLTQQVVQQLKTIKKEVEDALPQKEEEIAKIAEGIRKGTDAEKKAKATEILRQSLIKEQAGAGFLEIPIYGNATGKQYIFKEDLYLAVAAIGLRGIIIGKGNSQVLPDGARFEDWKAGSLSYRGVDAHAIKEAGLKFDDVIGLLTTGRVPDKKRQERLQRKIRGNFKLSDRLKKALKLELEACELAGGDALELKDIDPMHILSGLINKFQIHDQKIHGRTSDPKEQVNAAIRAASVFPIMLILIKQFYEGKKGEDLIFPDEVKDEKGRHKIDKPTFSIAETIVDSFFPNGEEMPNGLDREAVVEMTDLLLWLHGDHGFNNSNTIAITTYSSGNSIWTSLLAATQGLTGPLHGGANTSAMEMLKDIKEHPGKDLKEKVEGYADYHFLWDKDDGGLEERASGFGHAVYKEGWDPRAVIVLKTLRHLQEKFPKLKENEDLSVAIELMEYLLNSEKFEERNLFPNVDYFTGILAEAVGIPTELMTVIFATGRSIGWGASCVENMDAILCRGAEDPHAGENEWRPQNDLALGAMIEQIEARGIEVRV